MQYKKTSLKLKTIICIQKVEISRHKLALERDMECDEIISTKQQVCSFSSIVVHEKKCIESSSE